MLNCVNCGTKLATLNDHAEHECTCRGKRASGMSLPQVTTVEELDALPASAVLVDPYTGQTWRAWELKHGESGWTLSADALTVVWQP